MVIVLDTGAFLTDTEQNVMQGTSVATVFEIPDFDRCEEYTIRE